MLKKTPCNHTADVWSLAITAIEMAEGHPPRHELSLYQAIAQIPRLPAPTLAKPNEWSPEFSRFLARCLNKDYKLRPSAVDMLSDPWIQKAIRTELEAIKAAGGGSEQQISAQQANNAPLAGVPGANAVLMPFVADVLKRRTLRRAAGEQGTVDGTFNANSNAARTSNTSNGDEDGTMMFVGGTNVTSLARGSGNSVATTLPWNAEGTFISHGDDTGTMINTGASNGSVMTASQSLASQQAGDKNAPVKPHALAGIKMMDVTVRGGSTDSNGAAKNVVGGVSSLTSSSGSDGAGGISAGYSKLRGLRKGAAVMVEMGTQTQFSRKQRIKYWGTVLLFAISLSAVWNGMILGYQKIFEADDLLPVAVKT